MDLRQLLVVGALVGALGMFGCGDDSSGNGGSGGSGGSGGTPAGDCAECAENLVMACETAVEICIDAGVLVDQCIEAAIQEICRVEE
ncbi:MAG: hypothetical protein AAGF92_06265 [Myxococcota bacterium]